VNYIGGKIVSDENSGFIKYAHRAGSFLSYDFLYTTGEEVNYIITTFF